ncbi:hypothetical protein KKB55_11065 [Myxococcota bacterium]|nr:hypothetical protein [Myxococcota bacterium]MBU1898277.1 hypothetical protein [Myxococcota bacterium]
MAITRPDPLLSELVGSNEPEFKHLIGRRALEHVRVSSSKARGLIEILNSRPMQGQDHQINLNRGPKQKYPVINTAEPTVLPYNCVEVAPATDIDLVALERKPDKERHKRFMLKSARSAMRLNEEAKIAGLLFGAANWGSNTAALVDLPGASGKYPGEANAREFSDLAIARELASMSAGGRVPEVLAIGRSYFEALRRAVELRAYLGNQRQRIAVPEDELIELLIQVLGVDEVLVGKARRQTKIDGVAGVEADIWGPHAAFYWKQLQASEMEIGVNVTAATAVGIIEDLPDISEDGYFGKEILTEDPPVLKMVAGVSRDQVMLRESDTTQEPAELLSPRGFLVTQGVAPAA